MVLERRAMPGSTGRGRDGAIAEAERMFAEQLGQRLRWIRQQRRLSLRTVARLSGEEFRISVLGAYERGHRMISVARLQRLAELYEVSVDQLLPDAADIPHDASTNGSPPKEVPVPEEERRDDDRSPDSRVTLDLRRLAGLPPAARDLLGRYLGLIQLERNDESGLIISIRPEDMRAIACLLETTSAKAKERLQDLAPEPRA